MAMPRLLNGYYGMEERLWAQFQLFPKYRIGCRRNDVNAPLSSPNQGALSKYYSFIKTYKIASDLIYRNFQLNGFSLFFSIPVKKLLGLKLVLLIVTDSDLLCVICIYKKRSGSERRGAMDES